MSKSKLIFIIRRPVVFTFQNPASLLVRGGKGNYKTSGCDGFISNFFGGIVHWSWKLSSFTHHSHSKPVWIPFLFITKVDILQNVGNPQPLTSILEKKKTLWKSIASKIFFCIYYFVFNRFFVSWTVPLRCLHNVYDNTHICIC